MNANLTTLIKACEKLGIFYQAYHGTNNLVEVKIQDKQYLFVNWSTPCNPQSIAQLCKDKDYFYTFFADTIRMPKTKSFFNPECEAKYSDYLQAQNLQEIIVRIEENFSYPAIVKKNRGSWGRNVFKVENRDELETSLREIFNNNSSLYDYVALVQDFIPIASEYRVIYLNQKLRFVYEKNKDNATFIGNMSPLHWEGAKAILINDQKLLQEIDEFCQPLFQKLPIIFCGLDVALDDQGKWWLIEANSSPGFDHIIAGGGEEQVIILYQEMLKFLSLLEYSTKA